MLLPPGTYDVYWCQDGQHVPMLLISALQVDAGTLATIQANSGIQLTVASWVPALDPTYGWWGASRKGEASDARINWTRSGDVVLLPPGTYDVYWCQDGQHVPMLLAAAVEVGTSGPTEVKGS